MANSNNQMTPLEIYLGYDFLPASLLARTLTVLDALYEAVALDAFLMHVEQLSSPYPDSLRYLRFNVWQVWPWQPWLPLCIDAAETGNSIKVGFAAKGRSSSVRWRGGDFEVLLPRSTAPLCVIGVLLSAGGWNYHQYLDDELTRAKIENVRAQTDAERNEERLTEAQVELIRAETAAILARQARGEQSSLSPHSQTAHLEIRSQIQSFTAIVNQPNITNAKVNGIDVRHPSHRLP